MPLGGAQHLAGWDCERPAVFFLTPVLMVKAQEKRTSPVSSGCHEDTFLALKMSKGNDVFHILSDNDGSSHSSSELFSKCFI